LSFVNFIFWYKNWLNMAKIVWCGYDAAVHVNQNQTAIAVQCGYRANRCNCWCGLQFKTFWMILRFHFISICNFFLCLELFIVDDEVQGSMDQLHRVFCISKLNQPSVIHFWLSTLGLYSGSPPILPQTLNPLS
jgi:hypothetical protein